MPYYFFTITFKPDPEKNDHSGKRMEKTAGGIKQIDERDIEKVWHHWEHRYKAHYGSNFISFDVTMVSKRSQIYKDWLETKNKNPNAWNYEAPLSDLPVIYKRKEQKEFNENNSITIGERARLNEEKQKPPQE